MPPSPPFLVLCPSTSTRLRPLLPVCLSPSPGRSPRGRPFVSVPGPLTLNATRILPYPAAALYALISDIASYPSFLPFCTTSIIDAWSDLHPATSQRYPAAATLSIGFSSFTESFTSKVYCAPNSVVEAIAGNARCSIPSGGLEHYKRLSHPASEPDPLFETLLARWTLREFPFKPAPPDTTSASDTPQEFHTEVGLHIEAAFQSPVYGALSQAAAPKVAAKVIEAFEQRVNAVLGDKVLDSRQQDVVPQGITSDARRRVDKAVDDVEQY